MHSDRGIQYAVMYTHKLLKEKKIDISMNRRKSLLRNAMAERVNGI